MARTITIGNFVERKCGISGYYTEIIGYDIRIREDEKLYFYQLRSYANDWVTIIEPVEIEGAIRSEWEELNENVKKGHFYNINPNGTEIEMNLFVYGEAKGSKINEKNAWADDHLVHSRAVTLRLAIDLGRFSKVEFMRSVLPSSGTGHINYIYLIDNKWQVTVDGNLYNKTGGHNGYTIEDYTKIVAKQKAFGRRVARLAKIVDVPWNIATFVGHIESDEEAIVILKQIKAAKGTADENICRELSRGIERRTGAIELLLGETWEKLNCVGQRQTRDLANYLLSKD